MQRRHRIRSGDRSCQINGNASRASPFLEATTINGTLRLQPWTRLYLVRSQLDGNVTNLLSLSPSTKKMPSSGFLVWRFTITILADLVPTPTVFFLSLFHYGITVNMARRRSRTAYWWWWDSASVGGGEILLLPVTRYVIRRAHNRINSWRTIFNVQLILCGVFAFIWAACKSIEKCI